MTLGKFVVGLILLIVGIVFAIESKRAEEPDASGLEEREKNIKTILKENKKQYMGCSLHSS